MGLLNLNLSDRQVEVEQLTPLAGGGHGGAISSHFGRLCVCGCCEHDSKVGSACILTQRVDRGGKGESKEEPVVVDQLKHAHSPRERRMSKRAIRLLTLAIYATALVVVPMVTPAEAETGSGRHTTKHKKHIHWSPGVSGPRSAGQAWPVIRPSSQADVCPGIARGIDCKTWPPPMYDDPDRRNGSADGN